MNNQRRNSAQIAVNPLQWIGDSSELFAARHIAVCELVDDSLTDLPTLDVFVQYNQLQPKGRTVMLTVHSTNQVLFFIRRCPRSGIC